MEKKKLAEKFLENLTAAPHISTFHRVSSMLNKLPSKEKDPGSFTIPCDIGQLHINNALADLGASISLMPYTMYEKLGLGEPKATRMSLEHADRSIQYPRGIIENVLIKVDKFILPIDFVILDMPEDSRVPIILGRSFLATARTMIDVFNKKITLRVGDDEVIFDIDQSIKRLTTEDDECYGIDDLDDTINAEAQKLLANKEPDSFLSRGLEKSIDQSDLEGYEPVEFKPDNESDSDKPIRRITSINTPYPVVQEPAKPVEVERELLYSASANEIGEKKPELKDLPHHLEYAYLLGDKSFRIIISSELSEKEKISLLQVLEKRKGAIAWKMSDIKGISPSYYTPKILMEDDFKPVIQPQRRLNPKVQVKNKIVKLLDSSLIYPISDSSWEASEDDDGEILCMTRSSTNELFKPFKDPEREFRSSRRHFKTLSLDELRSPDFNLFSDQEYSEEEVAETMAETMEQYMSKTRADYGSGVARPKIKDKDNFELKG
ncbi:DNA-directed DNA polymerase [Tanacetum coccineum]|uniref:DNA-directed DNA polymerase n=1 Tax=Tanacetum coccineum TaxID=301880 RepID=A0ABQ5J3P3_9ASTR